MEGHYVSQKNRAELKCSSFCLTKQNSLPKKNNLGALYKGHTFNIKIKIFLQHLKPFSAGLAGKDKVYFSETTGFLDNK